MKWTKKIDEELISLIESGKNHSEIAIHFNVSKKAVQNRSFRLKVRVITHKDIVCKKCFKVFRDIISNAREFCSNSCANAYSNSNRKLTQLTKDKISNTLKISYSKKEKIEKVKKDLKRQCKLCQEFKSWNLKYD